MSVRRRGVDFYRLGAYILIIIFMVFAIIPVYWMLITAFKTPADTREFKFLPFIDFQPVLDTWMDILIGSLSEQTLKAIRNGLIIASGAATLSVVLGSLAGYALARFRYRRWKNRDIASFILAQRMMPPAVVLLPIFMFFSILKLIDTHVALILIEAAVNMPFAIWILMDFFREVPREVEEAAYLDGLTIAQTFYRISLRIALPGIVVAWILTFIFSWNEFLFVLALAYSETITLPWLISTGFSMRALEYWTISVFGTLAIIPPTILAFLIQRYIIRGMALGAVK